MWPCYWTLFELSSMDLKHWHNEQRQSYLESYPLVVLDGLFDHLLMFASHCKTLQTLHFITKKMHDCKVTTTEKDLKTKPTWRPVITTCIASSASTHGDFQSASIQSKCLFYHLVFETKLVLAKTSQQRKHTMRKVSSFPRCITILNPTFFCS